MAIEKITQSYKTKFENNSFGDEIFFGSNSDRIFYEKENNMSLTTKTKNIEDSIAKEIQDRIADVDAEEKNRQEAVKAEEEARIAAINEEILARTQAIDAVNKSINDEISNRTNDVQEVRGRVITLEGKMSTLESTTIPELELDINNNLASINIINNTTIPGINNNIETNTTDISNIKADITSITNSIGTSEVSGLDTILNRLADIEARLTALESNN